MVKNKIGRKDRQLSHPGVASVVRYFFGGDRATLGEIGRRLGRKLLGEVANVASQLPTGGIAAVPGIVCDARCESAWGDNSRALAKWREPPPVRTRPIVSFWLLPHEHQRIEETPMKPNLYIGLAAAALAITFLQASPATAKGLRLGGFGNIFSEENGFGSRTRVILPPDRHPPAGKSTGIPVTRTPSNVLTNAQPKYFRPR
jgi:hypothetical protein